MIRQKIVGFIRKIAKDHPFLRPVLRGGLDFCRLIRFKLETSGLKTDPKLVVFASFDGKSYSDSPKAVFEYMVRSGKFDDYTFVWGFRKIILQKHAESFKSLSERLMTGGTAALPQGESPCLTAPAMPKIQAVEYGGKEWRRCIAMAGYWILNYKVADWMKPRPDQYFLQTWHGTPLKRLGYDLEHFDNALNTRSGIQKRYGIETHKFSGFISQSPFASEKFRSAWRMDDFGKSDIMLEVGYPRNDVLINYTEDMVDSIKTKIFGPFYLPYEKQIKKKTIVLYAPTYRSNQHETGVGYVYHQELDFGRMRKELGDDFIILFRAHYFVAQKYDFDEYSGFVYDVSGVDDISELYLIADVLVTDYSSSMFDFSNLKRPMIFYMYDMEYYRDVSNGFYFDPEGILPGPIVKTEDDLINALKDCKSAFRYGDKYRKFNRMFNPFDDGHSSEKTVEAVFGK